jgi:nitrate reductase NapD
MRGINRRELLTASPRARHHISSAVVVALPARRESLVAKLATMQGVEVHAREGSRIVITIEGPTSGMLGETLAHISTLEGVISANMVFEHIDEHEGIRS